MNAKADHDFPYATDIDDNDDVKAPQGPDCGVLILDKLQDLLRFCGVAQLHRNGDVSSSWQERPAWAAQSRDVSLRGDEALSVESIDDDTDNDATNNEQSAMHQRVDDQPPTQQCIVNNMPSTLLIHIASYINDRTTFNALAQTCREVHTLCRQLLLPPWPSNVSLYAGPCSSHWSLAFSPDATILACGGGDGKIRLWHVRDGPQTPLTGHLGRVYALTFSQNVLASGSGDGDIRIWDLSQKDTTMMQLDLESPHVDSLAFSRDGTQLASGGDGCVRLWDTTSWQCTHSLREDHAIVEALAYCRNHLASGSWAHQISLWNVATQERIRTYRDTSEIRCLTCLHDGRIVSGADSGAIRVWDAAGNVRNWMSPNQYGCWDVHCSSDHVVSAHEDGMVRVWDARDRGSGRVVQTWKVFHDSVHAVSICNGASTSKTKLVAFAGNHRYVILRSLEAE